MKGCKLARTNKRTKWNVIIEIKQFLLPLSAASQPGVCSDSDGQPVSSCTRVVGKADITDGKNLMLLIT